MERVLHRLFLISAISLLGIAIGCRGDASDLRFLSEGATEKLGGFIPQRLALSSKPPDGVKKAPTGLSAPLYGVLHLGPENTPTRVVLLVDEPAGKTARFFVDTNANGDLTDDGAPTWNKEEQKGPDGKTVVHYVGSAKVPIRHTDRTLTGRLVFLYFDRQHPLRQRMGDALAYFGDYGYEGQLTLGERTFHAMLADILTRGTFQPLKSERGSGVVLFLDVNGNGIFDRRGEQYDVAKPFNIGGVTYEVADLVPSGASFRIVRSEKHVEEVLPPLDLSPGKKVPSFQVTTMDGQTIRFPEAYRGKLVLLDFWATWCGPCRAEMPNLAAAYKAFHERGLEVLGISLDEAGAKAQVEAFTRANEMPWPQVYDGKGWETPVAQLYDVDSIPRAYLVDGDTGEVLAAGADLRGEALEKTIRGALERKGR